MFQIQLGPVVGTSAWCSGAPGPHQARKSFGPSYTKKLCWYLSGTCLAHGHRLVLFPVTNAQFASDLPSVCMITIALALVNDIR